MNRAYRVAHQFGAATLAVLVLLGVFHSWSAHHRLPSLKENDLTPLNALIESGEVGEADETLDELCMASTFLANPDLARQLLAIAERAQHLDGRIFGTRRLIELGAARDAASFNRLAALLLKRAGVLGRAADRPRPEESSRDLREALRRAREAARLAPDDAESRLHQGLALAGLGQREEAVARLEEALRLDRDLGAARQVLQSLTRKAQG